MNESGSNRIHNVLEWLLILFMPTEHAAAVMGDLLEIAQTRGKLWLLGAYCHIVFQSAWRPALGCLFAYATGSSMSWLLANSQRLLRRHGFPVVSRHPSEMLLPFIATVAFFTLPLWFAAPYFVVRFGPGSRLTQLSVALCVTATLGVAFVFDGDPWAYYALVLCGLIVVALCVACLCAKEWRQPLGVVVGTNAIWLMSSSLLFHWARSLALRHPEWSERAVGYISTTENLIAFAVLVGSATALNSLLMNRGHHENAYLGG